MYRYMKYAHCDVDKNIGIITQTWLTVNMLYECIYGLYIQSSYLSFSFQYHANTPKSNIFAFCSITPEHKLMYHQKIPTTNKMLVN